MEYDFPTCDLLLVMGTSLVVQPFASLIGEMHRGRTAGQACLLTARQLLQTFRLALCELTMLRA